MTTDQRQIERGRATLLPVLAICKDERQIVLMTDYSQHGCGFRGQMQAQPGNTVSLLLGTDHEWQGTVSWNNGRQFGVAHHRDLAFALPATSGYRSVRSPMHIPCTVYAGGYSTEAIVENISLRGLGLRSNIAPGLGTLVSVVIGRTAFETATVRWVSGDRFGVRLQSGADELVHEVLRAASRGVTMSMPAKSKVAA